MKMKKSVVSPADIVIYLVLTVVAVSCIAPVIHILAVSLSSTAPATAGLVYFWPKQFTLNSYARIFEEGDFGNAFMISTVRVLVGTSLSLALIVLMAFPLAHSKQQFRARNVVMWLTVFTMLFGGGLIPTYITVKAYGLVDSFWSLVLPGALNVYYVILMMNFFKGIPVELEEAASIDYASPLRILLSIFLPLSLPALATIGLFVAVGNWNDYFAGMIYINHPEKYPLQTYIRQLVVQIKFEQVSSPEELAELMKVSSITFNSAKIFVSMIPVLCIYPFLQRFFVHGLVLGSVKG